MSQERVGRGETRFKPVAGRRTFELVSERVREKLASGELKPGDKLPPERDLAVQLGVSRNVVRESLRSLEIAGVVTLRKGVKGGAFVRAGEASRLREALSDLITLNAISLADLFDARILILETVIDQAFRDGRQPDVTRLEKVIAQTQQACEAGDVDARIECARAFYHELAALTENSAIVFTVDAQTELVQTFLQYRVTEMPVAALLQSRRDLVDCLRRSDTTAAKQELRAHMDRIRTQLWQNTTD